MSVIDPIMLPLKNTKILSKHPTLASISKTFTYFDIEKINEVRDLTIIQKTPIRVMHRRTFMDGKKINEKFQFVLFISRF